MANDGPLPVPQPGEGIPWLIANPQAVSDAFKALNLILALQVKLIKAGNYNLNQQQSLLISEQYISLNLPLFYPAGVPNPAPTYTGTAGAGYVQATLQALMNQVTALTTLVNLLVAGETAVQELPGSPP